METTMKSPLNTIKSAIYQREISNLAFASQAKGSDLGREAHLQEPILLYR